MADTTKFASIKDVGYRSATSLDVVHSGALYVMDKFPAFPDDLPDTLRAELYDGYKVRYNEVNPGDYYTVGDTGALIKHGKGKAPQGAIKVDVHVAYSYSQQEFGRLKATEPQKYELIQAMRSAFSKYAHNALKALMQAAKRIQNEGKTATRAATLCFTDAAKASFDTLEKRCKAATARGNDPTADTAKFNAAVLAFWSAYK